ncbi:MAG: hypothetical protein AAF518_27430 [Spirochaetota bacterium]
MQKRILTIIATLFLVLVSNCKDDPNPLGDYTQNFIFENILNIPINQNFKITSIEPARVHPGYTTTNVIITPSSSIRATSRQTTDDLNNATLATQEETFVPSLVLIKGNEFDKNPENHTVSIGSVQAEVFTDINSIYNLNEYFEYQPVVDKYELEKDILIKVPSGVETDLLTVQKAGGVCDSLDKKSGKDCSATEIYLDCYAAYNNRYGEENVVDFNNSIEVNYEGLEIKAFKTKLFENLPAENQNTLNISCSTIFSLKQFSRSCVPTDYTVDGSNLLSAPISIPISIEANKPWTIQYLITAGKGNCKVNILPTSLY